MGARALATVMIPCFGCWLGGDIVDGVPEGGTGADIGALDGDGASDSLYPQDGGNTVWLMNCRYSGYCVVLTPVPMQAPGTSRASQHAVCFGATFGPL